MPNQNKLTLTFSTSKSIQFKLDLIIVYSLPFSLSLFLYLPSHAAPYDSIVHRNTTGHPDHTHMPTTQWSIQFEFNSIRWRPGNGHDKLVWLAGGTCHQWNNIDKIESVWTGGSSIESIEAPCDRWQIKNGQYPQRFYPIEFDQIPAGQHGGHHSAISDDAGTAWQTAACNCHDKFEFIGEKNQILEIFWRE